MTRFTVRFAALNITGAAFVVAALVHGVGRMPFEADRTGLCLLISGVFVVGLLAVFLRRWHWAKWIGEKIVLLGLIGTVVGFVIALSGVDAESASNVQFIPKMVGALIDGMGTALMTTLLGAIGSLWLSLNRMLLDE